MELVIHIGTERTGSTSIQNNLEKEIKYLEENRVLYFHKTEFNYHELALAFGTNSFFDFSDQFNIRNMKDIKNKKLSIKNKFENKINLIIRKNKYDNLIISSELFSSRLNRIEEIKDLKTYLDPFFEKITIIVFKREETDFIKSLYSVALLAGHDLDFENFSKHVVNDKRYLPVESIISKWVNVFQNNVVVKDFHSEEVMKNPANTILQLISPDMKIISNETKNESKSSFALITIRIINMYFPKYKSWKKVNRRTLIGNILRSVLWKILR